jgi:Putative addiction module component
LARELKEIERDIQALSDEQRFDLLRSLIADLDGPADADVEEAWLAEAERRDRELESGTVQLDPRRGRLSRGGYRPRGRKTCRLRSNSVPTN